MSAFTEKEIGVAARASLINSSACRSSRSRMHHARARVTRGNNDRICGAVASSSVRSSKPSLPSGTAHPIATRVVGCSLLPLRCRRSAKTSPVIVSLSSLRYFFVP